LRKPKGWGKITRPKKMMNWKKCLFGGLVLLASGCTRPLFSTRPIVPPGQAEKISGSQSAKPHAPGQQKKLANRWLAN
jgi:hypothetical protein